MVNRTHSRQFIELGHLEFQRSAGFSAIWLGSSPSEVFSCLRQREVVPLSLWLPIASIRVATFWPQPEPRMPVYPNRDYEVPWGSVVSWSLPFTSVAPVGRQPSPEHRASLARWGPNWAGALPNSRSPMVADGGAMTSLPQRKPSLLVNMAHSQKVDGRPVRWLGAHKRNTHDGVHDR